MVTHMVYNVTADPLQTWCVLGSSRAEVEENYKRGIASGEYEAPVYRVIVTRRTPPTSHAH